MGFAIPSVNKWVLLFCCCYWKKGRNFSLCQTIFAKTKTEVRGALSRGAPHFSFLADLIWLLLFYSCAWAQLASFVSRTLQKQKKGEEGIIFHLLTKKKKIFWKVIKKKYVANKFVKNIFRLSPMKQFMDCFSLYNKNSLIITSFLCILHTFSS